MCVCVCVSTEGGGAEPSFPPLEVSKKIVRVIHQPHPPSLGPAVARAQRGKFLGGTAEGGVETMKAWGRFCWIPLQRALGMYLESAPLVFPPYPGPQTLVPGVRWWGAEGRAGRSE